MTTLHVYIDGYKINEYNQKIDLNLKVFRASRFVIVAAILQKLLTFQYVKEFFLIFASHYFY